jgi:hypothetical protein
MNLTDRVAIVTGLGAAEVLSSGKYKKLLAARSVLCFWAVRELGISLTAIARRLGMSPPGVGYAVQRGEAIVHDNGYQLTQ